MEERRAKEKEMIRASFRRGKDVCLQSFYFIDFQSLYEVPDRDDIRFLPCEVAIVEYSLHSGHCKHLHKFIDPGRLTSWWGGVRAGLTSWWGGARAGLTSGAGW